MQSGILWILGFVHFCSGQYFNYEPEGKLHKKRPSIPLIQQSSSPCFRNDGYDPVYEDAQGRKLLLAAGAAVGGAALGYHLGMKHQKPTIINNNIFNEYSDPCGGYQGVSSSSSSGTFAGSIASGGGILGHRPILSSLLQNGLGGGGGGGGEVTNRENSINWNRVARQFVRVVRPLARF